MIKQNVNIVNFNLLYEILEEIKDKLPFDITKYENEIIFIDQEKIDLVARMVVIGIVEPIVTQCLK